MPTIGCITVGDQANSLGNTLVQFNIIIKNHFIHARYNIQNSERSHPQTQEIASLVFKFQTPLYYQYAYFVPPAEDPFLLTIPPAILENS